MFANVCRWSVVAIVVLMSFTLNAQSPALQTTNQSGAPMEVHLAKDDGSSAHVHIFIRQAGISKVEVRVLDAEQASVASFSLVPVYATEQTAEALVKLSPEIAVIADSARVVAYSAVFHKGSGEGARVLIDTTSEAIPMAGCTGFCMNFRFECNSACWGPPCCGSVLEGSYWCGGEYPDCDGYCECYCPMPC